VYAGHDGGVAGIDHRGAMLARLAVERAWLQCALADARDSSARLALPERRPGTTFLWQLGDSASPSSAWDFRR
jgi:hypothetical protein